MDKRIKCRTQNRRAQFMNKPVKGQRGGDKTGTQNKGTSQNKQKRKTKNKPTQLLHSVLHAERRGLWRCWLLIEA